MGKTALGVAMIRAEESRRPDRLFEDPYAGAFLDAAPRAFEAEQAAAEEPGSDLGAWGAAFWGHAVIRTRFFDDWLLAVTADSIRQVVLLAAGLDSRAFRLGWPAHVTVYELDQPDMFEFKEPVLAAAGASARCARRVVPVDLRADWTGPLVDAGFDTTVRTAWLIEGLFIYLSPEDAERLLTAVGGLSAAASALAFEYESLGTDPMRARARRSGLMADYSAMWKGGLPDPVAWLATHGWQPERHDRAGVAARYERPAAGSEGGFVTATRR